MEEEEAPERSVDATPAIPVVHESDQPGVVGLGRMAPTQLDGGVHAGFVHLDVHHAARTSSATSTTSSGPNCWA